MANNFPISFGKDNQYVLTEQSFQHIIDGEFAVRPSKDNAGNKVQEEVLAGGLHTYHAWESFVAKHPGVVHLGEYDSAVHNDWYFARELQNGVITLKIPRRLYTGDAASITMQPDVHYKSGYLWKTLYPTAYSDADILATIREALENIDKEESSFPNAQTRTGVIYGYARVDRPFEAIRLRIQLFGNEIRSAFPSWDQPFTGNNGKPYSHEHSIGFQIAASTLGKTQPAIRSAAFVRNSFRLEALVSMTPNFLLSRHRPTYGIGQDEWRAARMAELQDLSRTLTDNEIAKIAAYLHDYVACKEPSFVQTRIYEHYVDILDRNIAFFNAAQLVENVRECCWVLSWSDRIRGSEDVMQFIVRFLSMAVVHAGALDTLQYKRLLGTFLEIAIGHHNLNSVKEFIDALSASPCRAALFTEFNLNPYIKRNNADDLCIIGVTGIEIAISLDHFFDFISLNLGENYLLSLDKPARLAIATELWKGQSNRRLLEDSLSFWTGGDFDFFIPVKYDPVKLAKTPPSENSLVSILRDYGRMLIVYRQRVVLEDAPAHSAQLDFSQWGTQEFFEITRQKHKRAFIRYMHEEMLQGLIELAEQQKFEKLLAKCRSASDSLPTERIPEVVPEISAGR